MHQNNSHIYGMIWDDSAQTRTTKSRDFLNSKALGYRKHSDGLKISVMCWHAGANIARETLDRVIACNYID